MNRHGTATDGSDAPRYDISGFNGKFSLLNRRWDGDMTAGVDAKGLTYTTPVLKSAVQVTGHPVHLSVSSTAPDAYFFAWLEDVDESGKSAYVTDGKLKAFHRAEMTHEPEATLGIPYHRSFQRDIEPMPARWWRWRSISFRPPAFSGRGIEFG